MADLSTEQSIEILLDRVPKPVRDYVLNELSGEVQRLMEKYQLHVDQGGVLQKELLLMLLGQEEPGEFMKELRATGIGEGTVQGLMVDINEDIFKPLRKREQAEGAAPAPRPMPAPPPEKPA